MKFALLKFLLIIAFLYSILITANQLLFFGLSYDESLFVNAAIGKDEVTFISRHWHGIPLMVMEYIGALKSWLYFPIFKVFCVNILSIRLPMVLLMYINFYLIYKIGIKYFDKTIIIVLSILLFTDYTFINLQKIDHGPTAIETFLKLACFYFLGRKVCLKNSFFIFAILILGVFNKLNFIWFVNALFGTYIVSYFILDTKESLPNSFLKKANNREFIFHCILYSLILIYFIFILKIQKISPSQPRDFHILIAQIIYQFELMVFTILNLRYEYLLGWSSSMPVTFYLGLGALLFIVFINIFWLFKRKNNIEKAHFQLFIFLIILATQYFFTKEASNIWHVLLLYPFVQLLILNSISKISQDFSEKAKFTFAGFTAVWVVFNLITYYNFEKKLGNQCSFWLYEPTINQLIDYTQTRPEANIISLGYGIHSQLLVLDKKEKSYLELINHSASGNFNDALSINLKYVSNFNKTLVVENIKSNLNEKRVNYQAMSETLASKGLQLYSVKVINDACGNPLYNVFKISRKEKNWHLDY